MNQFTKAMILRVKEQVHEHGSRILLPLLEKKANNSTFMSKIIWG